MYSASFLVLALAVFGASGFGCNSNCGSNVFGGLNVVGLSGMNAGNVLTSGNVLTGGNVLASGNVLTGGNGLFSGVNTVPTHVVSAPTVEHATVRLPSIVPPTTVQETCNCVNTVVRPNVRKEVYTFPSVQRFVQTTSTPVVETVPSVVGGASDLSTVGAVGGGVNGGFSNVFVNGLNNGLNGGVVSNGLNNAFVTGVQTGFVNGGSCAPPCGFTTNVCA